MTDTRTRTGPTPALRITIPFDAGRLSLNRTAGHHWRTHQRVKTAAKEAAALAYLQTGRPRLNVPVDVLVIVRRARRLDDDNLIGAVKVIRDVIFAGRLCPDDSPMWVRYTGVEQETGAQWRGREEVVFGVTPREVR